MINGKIKILLADDEIKIVRVIRDFLSHNGYDVITAHDGEQAINIFCDNSSNIDLVLLDVMMPKHNGLEVLSYIRKESCTPTVMLTAKGEEYDQLEGFHTGADDYIVKPFSLMLLLARIEALLKRTGKKTGNTLVFGNININVTMRKVMVGEREINFKRREFDLLYYLVINKNVVLSRASLLNNVWGYDFEGDSRTVDTHIKQIRAKLGKAADKIKTAYGVGYKFEE